MDDSVVDCCNYGVDRGEIRANAQGGQELALMGQSSQVVGEKTKVPGGNTRHFCLTAF